MKLIDTQWLFYGESPVPWWGLALLAVAFVAVAIRWLRVEIKRASLPAKCLPWTLALLFVLAAWLVYHPVLIRVNTWEHEGQRLAYLDTSDSMSEPFAAPGDVTAALDLLGMSEPTLLKDRPIGALQLRSGIRSLMESAVKQRASLESIHEQLSQGVPLAESASKSVGEYQKWSGEARRSLRALLAGAQLAVEAIPAQQAPSAGDATRALALLSSATESLREEVGELTPAAMQATIGPLDQLIEAAGPAARSMPRLQALCDAAFLAQHETTLKGPLDTARRKTRGEVARDVMRKMAVEPAKVARTGVAASGRQTDLYGDLASLLRQHEGEILSGIYVFSDGGHNGGSRAEVLDEVRKLGIPTVSVGVGSLSSGGVDLAILDWDSRRVTGARKDWQVGVLVKSASGVKSPYKLSLTADGAEIFAGEFVTDGNPTQRVTLRAKAPDAGRHAMQITLTSGDDWNKRNNSAAFSLDTVEGVSQALIVGPFADWDTAYLTMAAQRNGLLLRQAYVGDTPRRGEAIDAVPNSGNGWAKYRVVVLKGTPFKSFSEADANDLHQYVTEAGGSLVIFADENSYVGSLSKKFNWAAGSSSTLPDAHVRIPADAVDHPMLKLGLDGPQSAQLLASLPAAERAVRVPPQDVVLLTNAEGEPVLSMGAYGKGRVFLLGVRGFSAQREYSQARVVDRLLKQIMGEAAIPPAAALPGVAATQSAAAKNPGMEELYCEFNEPFMTHLAESTGGRYVPAAQAQASDGALKPVTWREATADRYPLAEHWLLIVAMVVVATLHWILRKLAGLAI